MNKRSSSSFRAFLSHAIIALVTVLLCFAKHISMYFDHANRFYYHWVAVDGLAIIATVMTIALLVATLGYVLERSNARWLLKSYDHLLMLALIGGILSVVPVLYKSPRVTQLIWLLVMFVAGCSFSCKRSPLTKWSRSICLIMSPLVPMVFIQLLSLESWGSPAEPKPTFSHNDEPGSPILWFVFDGWSYSRSTEDGELKPYFDNLRQLANDSFVFSNAQSAYEYTTQSIPKMLYQTSDRFYIEDGVAYFVGNQEQIAATERPSLFDQAKRQGYFTSVVGWGLPYRKILGNQIDYCHHSYDSPKSDSFLGKMALMATLNFGHLTDQLSIGINNRLFTRINSEHFVTINARQLREMDWLIKHGPKKMMALFHFVLPHYPFVFDYDGSYRGPYDAVAGASFGTPQDYELHLRYMDKIIGERIQNLKDAQKYEDALIIVTGDHSWGGDPEGHDNVSLRHVPLFIKLPHQESSHVISTPQATNDLQALFDLAIKGNATAASFAAMVQGPRQVRLASEPVN